MSKDDSSAADRGPGFSAGEGTTTEAISGVDVPGTSTLAAELLGWADLQLARLEAMSPTSGGVVTQRECTCHPDDNPPQPCAKQYALEECRAMSYATTLATALHAKHYAEVTQWKPLPDLLGVLTQIDNMTAGLKRA